MRQGIVNAFAARKSVEDVRVENNILVATFKAGRQQSAKTLEKRLKEAGFTAIRRGRVLGVRVPVEFEEQERMLRVVRGRGPSPKEVAEKMVRELAAD